MMLLAAQRFPPPEFSETGHQLPGFLAPAARAQFFERLDVAVLVVALAMAAWLVLRQRARRGLARALLSKRPVLLLDEPVAHLDHATADAVMGDLTHSANGRSVIMVSHRRDGLAGFDRVIDLSRRARDQDQVG